MIRPTTKQKRKTRQDDQGQLWMALGIVAGILTFAASSIPSITALSPNYPGYEKDCNCTWENVHAYRKRRGINYAYRTKFIHPELCRTRTEEQCQALDQGTMEDARRKRRLQLKSGSLKVLVLLIQWTNHADKELIPMADIDQLFNSDEIDENLLPTGSVKRFFQVNSYNQLSIDATVVDWTMTDNTELFYSQLGDRGRDQGLQQAFRLPLEALDATGFDFTSFDQDGDGRVDMTVILHSGYDGLGGSTDCNTGALSSERIAAHATAAAPDFDWVSSDGVSLGGYVVASAYRMACNANIARIGVLVHEMFHPFGMPDLYDGAGALDPNSGSVGGKNSIESVDQNALFFSRMVPHFSRTHF
jgi:M6 family metalloprotease-like protein